MAAAHIPPAPTFLEEDFDFVSQQSYLSQQPRSVWVMCLYITKSLIVCRGQHIASRYAPQEKSVDYFKEFEFTPSSNHTSSSSLVLQEGQGGRRPQASVQRVPETPLLTTTTQSNPTGNSKHTVHPVRCLYAM